MDEPGEPQSSNINADELDEETKEKLKGDMIGDTLYSESFVIRTLMNLSDLKYSEEMENDLCFLWDMTIEKDVCKFLFDLQYPSLACTALVNCSKERYIEVLIGILANMLLADCEKVMTDNEIKLILSKCETEDTAVLIQIMRFMEAIAYTMPEQTYLLEVVVEGRMQYILEYSENVELITHTMQALMRLMQDFKLNKVEVNSLLFEAVIEGFDTIFSVQTNNFEIEIDTAETSKIVKTFLNIITSMCAYIQQYHHDDEIPTAINNCGKLAVTICRILNYFSEEKNLFPLTADFNEYISAFQTIVTTCDVNIIQDLDNKLFFRVFNYLCKILYLLHRCKSELLESFNLVLEFIGCLIHIVDERAVLTELKNIRYKKVIVVLNSLKESSRTFEFDISDKLRILFSEFK